MSKIPRNYSTITYRAGLPVAFDGVPVVPVQGCPVKDGGSACCRNCPGDWDGTPTTIALTRALNNGITIDLSLIACQPIRDRIESALPEIHALQSVTLFSAPVGSVE